MMGRIILQWMVLNCLRCLFKFSQVMRSRRLYFALLAVALVATSSETWGSGSNSPVAELRIHNPDTGGWEQTYSKTFHETEGQGSVTVNIGRSWTQGTPALGIQSQPNMCEYQGNGESSSLPSSRISYPDPFVDTIYFDQGSSPNGPEYDAVFVTIEIVDLGQDDSGCIRVEFSVPDPDGGSPRVAYLNLSIEDSGDANHPPDDITLSSTSVFENEPTGAIIGSLGVHDPDSGQSHDFRLGPLNDQFFSISGTTLRSTHVFDYGGPSKEYDIQVIVEDNGVPKLEYDENFTIYVQDVPEDPVLNPLQDANVQEPNQYVGTASATDDDVGTGFVYSLADDFNDLFTINSGTGRIDFSAPSNYEPHAGANVFTLDVIVDDGTGRTDSESLNVTLQDVNEPPSVLFSDPEPSVVEDAGAGVTIGTVTVSDPDNDDGQDLQSHSVKVYPGTATSDPESTLFEMSGSDLVTKTSLAGQSVADYEVTIVAKETGSSPLQGSKTITIDVDFLPDPPTIAEINDVTIPEGSAPTTLVLDISDPDTDLSDLTVTAVSQNISTIPNNDASYLATAFNAIENQWELTFKPFSDAEASVEIKVTVKDPDDLIDDTEFWVHINADNDPPSAVNFVGNPVNSVTEGISNQIEIGTLAISDDGPGSNSLSVDIPAQFEIINSRLYIKNEVELDHEGLNGSLTVEIRVTDLTLGPGPHATLSHTVAILDADPTVTLIGVLPSVDEALEEDGSVVASAIDVATIQIGGDTVGDNYLRLDPEPNDVFEIVQDQGEDKLRIKAGAEVDFEADPSHIVKVLVSDMTTPDPNDSFVEHTVAVNNMNEDPTSVTLAPQTVPENLANHEVGTLITEDPDNPPSAEPPTQTHSYSFLMEPNTYFEIIGDKVYTKAGFNAESITHLSNEFVIIAETVGVPSETPATTSVTITIEDVDEPASQILLPDTHITENQGPGEVVGILSTNDPDSSAAFSDHDFTLTQGTSLFEIVGNELRAKAALNRETGSTHVVKITAQGSGGLEHPVAEHEFTITVDDVDEPASQILLPDTHITENQAAGEVVGILSTDDPDSPAVFSDHDFTLTQGTSLFEIVGNELRAKASLNREAASSHVVKVTAQGSGGLEHPVAEHEFTITVDDVDEPASQILLPDTHITENQAAGEVVGFLSTDDPDFPAAFSEHDFTLTQGTSLFEIVGNELRATVSLDREANSSHLVKITAQGSGGLQHIVPEHTFSIIVDDLLDEPPSLQPIEDQSTIENTEFYSSGLVQVSDPDNSISEVDVNGTSSNSSLVSNSSIEILGTGFSRDLRITPEPNQTGTTTITLTATDPQNHNSPSIQFVLTVDPGVQPPSIATLRDEKFPANEPFYYHDAVVISDPDTPISALTVSGESSDETIITDANVQVIGTGAERDLWIQPVENQFGPVMITLTVDDGTTPVPTSFQYTVLPKGIPPAETDGDTLFDHVENKAGNGVKTAPPDLSDWENLDSDGDTLRDDVELANGFDPCLRDTDGDGVDDNIEFGNTPPIAVADYPVVEEGDGDVTLNPLTNDSDTPDGDLPLVIVSVEPLSQIGGSMTIAADGQSVVYIRPGDNILGVETYDYTIRDTRGGDATATITVSLENNNLDPVISPIVDIAMPANVTWSPIEFTVVDPDGPAIGTTMTFETDNPNLFPTDSLTFSGTDEQRSLSLTPTSGQFGTAAITLRAFDGSERGEITFNVRVGPHGILPAETDGDSLFDYFEDSSGDGFYNVPPDFAAWFTDDTDSDLIKDDEEALKGLNPNNPDSDGDGVPDVLEFLNTNPIAVADTFDVQTGISTIILDVLANDSFAPDIEETLEIISVTDPEGIGGTVFIDSFGNLRYVAPTGIGAGVDTFSYTISDGNGGTASALVTVNAQDFNFPPLIFPMSDISMPANVSWDPFELTLLDQDNMASEISVSAEIGDTELFSSSSLAVQGTDWTRTFGLSPAAGKHGATTLTLTSADMFDSYSVSLAVQVGPHGLDPADSDGDGVPDYLENPTGTGEPEPGENPWAENSAPLLTVRDEADYRIGTLQLLYNTAPSTFQLVDPDIAGQDSEQSGYGGGFFEVVALSGAVSDDKLSLVGLAQSGTRIQLVDTDEIHLNGVHVGTLESDGVLPNALRVSFMPNTSMADAIDLMLAVTFENSNTSVSEHTLTVGAIINDGRGGTSNLELTTINATYSNLAPIIEIEGDSELVFDDGLAQGEYRALKYIDPDAPVDPATELPVPLALTWSKASGPGNVTFDMPDAPVTGATFDQTGDYVLQLLGSDGVNSSSASILVEVDTAEPVLDLPPIVDAGVDQVVANSAAVQLSGTAEDPFPENEPPSVVWTWVQLPEGVSASPTLNQPLSLVPTFTPDGPGDYVVQLTATDTGGNVGRDDVTITVLGSDQASNAVPIVHIAPLPAITLPPASSGAEAFALLDAHVIDDSEELSYEWSIIYPSDEANVSFLKNGHDIPVPDPEEESDPLDTEDIEVRVTAEGFYVFSLTVDDGEHSVDARVTLQVCSEARGGKDIMFVVDVSPSSHAQGLGNGEYFETTYRKMLELMEFFQEGADRVGVVSCLSGTNPVGSWPNRNLLEFPLGTPFELIREAHLSPAAAEGDGPVNITGGLQIAQAELMGSRARTGTEKMIVLISDGESIGRQYDEALPTGSPLTASIAAKGAGIELVVIGIFDKVPSESAVPSNLKEDALLSSLASTDAYFRVTELDATIDFDSTLENESLVDLFAGVGSLTCGSTVPFEVRINHRQALVPDFGNNIVVDLDDIDIVGGIGPYDVQWEMIAELKLVADGEQQKWEVITPPASVSASFNPANQVSTDQIETQLTFSNSSNPSHFAIRLNVTDHLGNEGNGVSTQASGYAYFRVSDFPINTFFSVSEGSRNNLLEIVSPEVDANNNPSSPFIISSDFVDPRFDRALLSVLAHPNLQDDELHPNNLGRDQNAMNIRYDAPHYQLLSAEGHPLNYHTEGFGGVLDFFRVSLESTDPDVAAPVGDTLITVYLEPRNGPPVAVDDWVASRVGGSTEVNVLTGEGDSLELDENENVVRKEFTVAGRDFDFDDPLWIDNRSGLIPFRLDSFDGQSALDQPVSLSGAYLHYTSPVSEGTDSFGYRIVDSFGLTSDASVEVLITDDFALLGYEAIDDYYVIDSSGLFELQVLGNDLGGEEKPSILSVDSEPTGVSLVTDAGGNDFLQYAVPATLPAGPLQFTYRISDPPVSGEDPYEATVTIGFTSNADPALQAEITNLDPASSGSETDEDYLTITDSSFSLQGIVEDANNPHTLLKYTVGLYSIDAPELDIIRLHEFRGQVTSPGGQLMDLDLSGLQDGFYRVELKVFTPRVKTDGPEVELEFSDESSAGDTAFFRVRNGTKIGQFELRITDLEIPVAGVPLAITRNYSTGNRKMGDFGMGWTLDVTGVTLETASMLGDGWKVESQGLSTAVTPDPGKIVRIRYDDGRVALFSAAVDANGTGSNTVGSLSGSVFDIIFSPFQDTVGTLKALGAEDLTADPPSGTIVALVHDPGQGQTETFDAGIFEYTDESGRIFRFERAPRSAAQVGGTHSFDLVSVRAMTGEGLLINRLGAGKGEEFVYTLFDPIGNPVTEDSATKITIHRDFSREGRITAIYAPADHDEGGTPIAGQETLRYIYAPYRVKNYPQWYSFLTEVHRRDGENHGEESYQKTWYHYDNYIDSEEVGLSERFEPKASDHLITRIDNEHGQIIRNEYDDQGRLIASIDGEGGRTEYEHHDGFVSTSTPFGLVVGRETVEDPLGNRTTHDYDEHGNVLLSLVEDPTGKILSKTGRKFEDPEDPELVTEETVFIDLEGTPKELTTIRAYDNRYANKSIASLTIKQPFDAAKEETVDDFVSSYEFDPFGRITEVMDAEGGVTIYVYRQSGQFAERISSIIRVVDGGGQDEVTDFDYTADSKALEVPSGSSIESVVVVLLMKVTAPDGSYVVHSQDLRGYTVFLESFDKTGRRLDRNWLSYDLNGNLVSEVLTRSVNEDREEFLELNYQYDAAGRLRSTKSRIRRPDENWVEIESNRPEIVFNSVGHRSQEIRRRSVVEDGELKKELLVTSFEYDARGNLVKTKFPDGTSSSSVYDRGGRLSESYDQAGRKTKYTYDGAGRLTETEYPDGSKTSSEYDEAGRVKASLDRRGFRTSYEYDARGHRTKSTNSGIESTVYEYDKVGNLTETIDGRGNITQYFYDKLNRPESTKFFGSDRNKLLAQVKTGYDRLGRVKYQVDEDEIRTRFAYDGLGRLNLVTLAETTPDHTVTTYDYDEQGNLRFVEDARNKKTTYGYDHLGRRISRKLPQRNSDDMREERFRYDEAGNLTKKTLLGKPPTEQEVTELSRIDYSYDKAGRRTETSSTLKVMLDDQKYEFAPVRYIYSGDVMSRVVFPQGPHRVPDPSGDEYEPTIMVIDYTGYDPAGRLTRKEGFTAGSAGGAPTETWKLEYDYDEAGDLKELSTEKGTTTNYGWDPLSRLNLVTDGGWNCQGEECEAEYRYDAVGNLSWMKYPNGVTVHYKYDYRNRLEHIEYRKPGQTTPLASFAYTLGDTGRRDRLKEKVGGGMVVTHNYKYDPLGRLTEAIKDDAVEITTELFDEHEGYGDSEGYDPVGNHKPTNALDELDELDESTEAVFDDYGNLTGDVSSNFTFVYDYENRLIHAKNGNTIEITYDPDGNRVRKNVNGAVTQFLVDDKNPTGYSQVIEERDASGNRSRHFVYGLDLISHQDDGASPVFYGYDGLGNVRFLMDESGNITETFDYKPFGTLTGNTPTNGDHYLFTGEQYDADLGLYYLRARYYDPETKRFLSRDPFEGIRSNPLTMHPYAYAHNDPVNYVDPSGHFANLASVQLSVSQAVTIGTVGIAATIAITSSLMTNFAGSPPNQSQEAALAEVREIISRSQDKFSPNVLKYVNTVLRARIRVRENLVVDSGAYATASTYGQMLGVFPVIHLDPQVFELDTRLFAATLLHEAVHVYQWVPGTFDQKVEPPAHQVESDALKAFGISASSADEAKSGFSNRSDRNWIDDAELNYKKYGVVDPAIGH